MSPQSVHRRLTFYSGFAAHFGEPERGAQMVDQVMRLDPNYPMWTSNFFSHAYFMAGRYEDAVKMLERMTPNNYHKWNWVVRSSSLAALGRTDEANASVLEALKQHPDLTVESVINESGLSTMERSRFIETMPLAGFPACAKPEALAKLAKSVRLPECEAGKAKPASSFFIAVWCSSGVPSSPRPALASRFRPSLSACLGPDGADRP